MSSQREQETTMELEARCVVRLAMTTWRTPRGIFTKKALVYLKRQCHGYNFLQEDVEMAGAEEFILLITNLYDSPDGIYEVRTRQESRDWELGRIESYTYFLLPFQLDSAEPKV